MNIFVSVFPCDIFFHAYFEQTISLFYAVPIEMRKKETNQSFVQKKKKNSNNCQCAVKPNCFVYYFLFVCASVFNIFLKYSNSWMLFSYWKDSTMYKRSDTNTTKQNNISAGAHARKKMLKQTEKIFFSAKTADQNHRYLHLEPNFYDNLSRSLATNASLEGNT